MNTLNLMLHQGSYEWTDDGSLTRIERENELPHEKPESHTQALADIILETKSDLIMLQEVEGWDSLDRFNRRYLEDGYKTYLPPTNDTRIGIAFLVRNGMGLKVKRESFVHKNWKNPTGKRESIFSRNFPLFKIFFENHDVPKLIVAGVHYKSRIDRRGDPRSFEKRKREAEESVRIIQEVQAQHPNTPVIIMGDFNSNKNYEELASFKDLDVFDLLEKPEVFQDEHGMGDTTMVFYPKGDGSVRSRSVDGAFLSSSLRSQLLSSFVYRFKDPKTGLVIPFPQNIDERRKNPSDHYPVVFDLAPEVLYPNHQTRN